MSGSISASTLAYASLAMGALGTGMNVMGQMQQGQAQSAMYGYQAAVMRNNQQIAEMQAADALKRGLIAETQQREKGAQRQSTMLAGLAGQGTDISGSATDILGDAAASTEFDALTARANAAKEAWGYRVKALDAGNNVSLSMAQQGASGSLLGAGGALIGGAGSVADKWYKYGRGGAFGIAADGGKASYDISGGIV